MSHRLSLPRCIAAAALATALAPKALAQGETGFLRGLGHTDVAITYGRDDYDEFWVGDDKVSNPPFEGVERTTWNLYVAHGLTNELDLVASGSFAESETETDVGIPDEDDFQDMIVGLKWLLTSSRAGPGTFSFLLFPGIKFPLTDYEDNAVTALGDGQVDLRARAILHYRFDAPFFISLEGGYDRRNGAPDDEVPINLTVGGTFFDKLTVAPFYSIVDSQGGIDISDVPALGGFPAVEEDIERWGIGVYGRLTETIGVTASWKTTLDGKNTGDAEGFTAGLVFSF